MRKVIEKSCYRATQLLLCLFMRYHSSCSTLKVKNKEFRDRPYSILRVGVCGQNLVQFMKTLKAANLTVTDVEPMANDPCGSFLVLFEFSTKDDFLLGRSEILSTGLVAQIN